jgi:hypothetical protein
MTVIASPHRHPELPVQCDRWTRCLLPCAAAAVAVAAVQHWHLQELRRAHRSNGLETGRLHLKVDQVMVLQVQAATRSVRASKMTLQPEDLRCYLRRPLWLLRPLPQHRPSCRPMVRLRDCSFWMLTVMPQRIPCGCSSWARGFVISRFCRRWDVLTQAAATARSSSRESPLPEPRLSSNWTLQGPSLTAVPALEESCRSKVLSAQPSSSRSAISVTTLPL